MASPRFLPAAVLMLPWLGLLPGHWTLLSEARAETAAAVGTVRFVPEKDYGPFVYEDDEGVLTGLSIDFLREIVAKTGLDVVDLPARDLAENLDLAQRGEVDLLSSLRPTPQRAVYLSFTDPYVTVPAVLVVLQSKASGESGLGDLEGRPVGVGKGYGVEAFVKSRFPKVEWVAVGNDAEGLERLRAGEVAGMVADIASVNFVAAEQDWTDLYVVGNVGFDYPLSFAFSKDRPEIGEALELGLLEIEVERRQEIVDRWLGVSTTSYADSRVALVRTVALVLGAAALFLAGAGILLRRKRRGQSV